MPLRCSGGPLHPDPPSVGASVRGACTRGGRRAGRLRGRAPPTPPEEGSPLQRGGPEGYPRRQGHRQRIHCVCGCVCICVCVGVGYPCEHTNTPEVHELPVKNGSVKACAHVCVLTDLTDTFLTLKPTLSPGSADSICSWCISTDFTSVDTWAGENMTVIPGLRMPVSTRPTGTVPIPPICAREQQKRREVGHRLKT